MWNTLEKQGRGKVFDEVLRKHAIYSKTEVMQCLAQYRSHVPRIALYREAERCLKRFGNESKYLVTDGHSGVQAKKLEALDLHRYFKRTMITNRFGLKHQKPSPYCFLKICQWERVEPEQVVYVGDNPRKDFVGIKPLGFRTVQVMTGQHKEVNPGKKYMAHVQIDSLKELTPELLKGL
jgi:putative hydrolase of the HAD superfamily